MIGREKDGILRLSAIAAACAHLVFDALPFGAPVRAGPQARARRGQPTRRRRRRLDGEKLEVVQTLQRVRGQLRLVPPKTNDSSRTVPLPKPCVEALREHKRRQLAERSDAWPDWEDHGLVFPSRRGTPMEPDNLRRSWEQIRRAAGIGQVRFHDLRHTCVTLLLDLGL
jgi:integrase